MKIGEVVSLWTLVGVVSKNEFYICNSSDIHYSWNGFYMHSTIKDGTVDYDWFIGETRREFNLQTKR